MAKRVSENMRRDHAEQIMEALEPTLRLPNENVREMLVQRIMGVNLKPGREPQAPNKSDFIEEAREFAREWLKNHSDVCVKDVTDQIPLPPSLPPDTVGGIFKHPDFVKVGARTITMPKGHRPRNKKLNIYVLAGEEDKHNNLIVSWD